VIAGLQPGPNPIKCYLHVGPNYLDQPLIRVTNYQTVTSGTTVTISVSNIKNLGTGTINTAYAAVMLFYQTNQEQAYLYRPISKLMLATTDLSTVPFTTCSLSYTGNNVVLTSTSLNISLTPTYNIQTTDYIVVTFPNNTVDPFNPTSISCANCIVYLYYKSGLMRIYLKTPVTAGTQVNINLINFPM
jgi:hypothetical protein